VLQRLPFVSMSDTVTRTGIVIARYDSASAVLPGLTYLSSVPRDTALRPVSTNTVSLTVQRVPVDSTGQAREIKPVMSVPYTLAEILLFAGILLLVAVAGYLTYRYIRKTRERTVPDTRLPVLKAAHVVAYEHLAVLKEKRLWQQGKVKEYHTELTDILRRYLEDRFGLMALEETTAEIVEGLQRMKLLPRIVGQVSETLVRADLVKFAKHKPEVGEHDASMKAVYDVVERTKAAPSTTGHASPPSSPATLTAAAGGNGSGRSGSAPATEGAHVGS
jgi:hypothetical protein